MSDQADRLARYRSKRDFSITGEPSGTAPPPARGSRFVVQRHRARRLHYDLRLEMAGVLVSWAVPKGPTLDPSAKRMAVHVEDHPLDYFDFEGIIPKGQYGAGDVIVWDWGTWRTASEDDPVEAVEAGELHFDLEGEKLHGRFVLVRRGRPDAGGQDQWILLHKADEVAVKDWDAAEHPRSVKSGRTNEEVAADPGSLSPQDPARHWQAPSPDEMDALEAMGDNGDWMIGGREVRLTNLEKVLFPGVRGRKGAGAVTKRDLIRYHAQVAPYMLRYLSGRAVNLQRFPEGVEANGFWQKAVPSHAPDWLSRWTHEGASAGRTSRYLVLDSPAALVWAANHAAVELHPWISATDRPDEPSWAMIDIDPGSKSSFEDVLVLARLYRSALEHLRVEAAPKVTGKRGIQIWVPVAQGSSFDQTRSWVYSVSRAVGQTVPDLVSWSWERSQRGGLARLDYTQNTRNRTLVAPFSARPAAGAPVSVPLRWEELDDPDLRPDRWNVRTVMDRLEQVGDPMASLAGMSQVLPSL